MNAITTQTTVQVLSLRGRKAEVTAVRTDEHGDEWYTVNLGGGWVREIHETDAVGYVR